jgi:ADP-ribosylglycohydrolase
MDNVKQNLILGALIADAATCGLHWIYDQHRISAVAGKTPEFHPPTQSDYDGVPSFFAHGKRSVGDCSHYGEQSFVLLNALASNNGKYDRAQYQNSFRDHFSYGGDYIGYIDRPTKDTLDNITLIEHGVLQQANALPFQNTNDAKQNVINLAMTKLKQNNNITSNELKDIIASELSLDIELQYLNSLLSCLSPLLDYQGADDVQLPAISKLPALAAAYANHSELSQHTESAVRVTNNNDTAISYGHIASKMMEAAITTQHIDKVIEAGRQAATPDSLLLIDNALNTSNKTTPEFTKQIGMSCNLELGMPSVFHTLNQHLNYPESIRQNIIAGGDSCGRSILLGAILGAIHGIGTEKGIPTAWHEKLSNKQSVAQLMAIL